MSSLCALVERVGITFRGKRRSILRNSFERDTGSAGERPARRVKKGPECPFRAALAQEADYRVSSFFFLSNHLHLAA